MLGNYISNAFANRSLGDLLIGLSRAWPGAFHCISRTNDPYGMQNLDSYPRIAGNTQEQRECTTGREGRGKARVGGKA